MRVNKNEVSRGALPAANGVERGVSPARRSAAAGQPPEPLRKIVVRAQQALADMATSATPRADMHAFRNALADLCALTFPNQDVIAAVTYVVEESECYAELTFGKDAGQASATTRQRCHDRVWNALQQVIVSLAEAKPSSVASALGRTW